MTHFTAIVELRRREWRWVISQETGDSIRLVRWQLEEVAEAPAAEYHLHACALRIVDCRARIDLRCANACHERAAHREVRVEACASFTLLICDACEKWLVVSSRIGLPLLFRHSPPPPATPSSPEL